ncbi:GlcG/HbpS family heme-binding protein [Streptacidiphilus sp. PAMC 29251]
MTSLTQATTAEAVLAGIAKATEINVRMNIAVVDAGGHLVQFSRMDGAWLGSIDIALKKARTASLFRLPTAVIGQISQPGGPVYGIEHSNGGLVTFGGGLPISDGDGGILGAVGVSGGSVQEDTAVAEAVVQAVAEAAAGRSA